MATADLTAVVDLALDLALGRAPGAGTSRLVCVDGPAGSGKTTLAEAVAAECRRRGLSVSLVHLDDVLVGWRGLEELGPRVHRGIVRPLAAGASGRYRRYDWLAGALAEEQQVPAADLVLLEGVGAGHPGYADRVAALVWVEAPEAVRLRRGLERDGAELAPQWHTWMRDEAALHARERTRERADLLVDGTSGTLSRPPGADPPVPPGDAA
jgi:uridine kinase